MSGRNNTSPYPTQPRITNSHVSQRGMLSIVMLIVSIGTLGIAMIGGAKLAYDVLGPEKDTEVKLFSAIVALAIAYGVGWLTAMVANRVYGNLVLPILINWLTWICLAGVCYLYIEILKRLYGQEYEITNFVKYVTIMLASLTILVGLHLIIEDHNLRPYAIPLLIIAMIQLGLIVYRYVFIGGNSSVYLLGDLFFLGGMSTFSIFTLAHFGMLDPLRAHFTNYFDRNSVSIRTQD